METTTMSHDELLDRATRPGGPLHSVVEEVERQAEVERVEREAQLEVERQEVAETLADAERSFTKLSDDRWAIFLSLAELDQHYRDALENLRACQRRARALGVEVAPVVEKVVDANRSSEMELRKQAEMIQQLLARGL